MKVIPHIQGLIYAVKHKFQILKVHSIQYIQRLNPYIFKVYDYLMTFQKFHQSKQTTMMCLSTDQSDLEKWAGFIHYREKKAYTFPFGPARLKCHRDVYGQTLRNFVSLWSAGTAMAPSTQLKETIADMHEGIRAILLGPPGAGKGTQVRKSYSTKLVSR